MRTADLVRKYNHIFHTDYTADLDCVSAYLMLEGSGTALDNAQGNSALDGVFKGSGEPAWDTTDVAFHISGSAPNSLVFDGSDDYVDCNDADASTSFSIVAWGYKHTTGQQTILGKCDSGFGSADYYFRINGASGYKGSVWLEVTVPDVELNVWHHHALTWAGHGGYLIYWLDGVNTVQSVTIYNDEPVVTDYDCRIGEPGEYNGQYWNGGITEVALFSDALTSTEINEIYDYGLKPAAGGVSASVSPSVSPSTSISASKSPSASPSVSPSASYSPSVSESLSPSVSPSISPSTSPSGGGPGTKNYSRGEYVSLPSDDSDLSTYYTEEEITEVGLNNSVRIDQETTGKYAIHQYREQAGSATSGSFIWNGQCSLAPSASIVKLQIYNFDTPGWEDLDSDNASDPDIDFDLQGVIPDLENYKSPTNEVVCRVWQQQV